MILIRNSSTLVSLDKLSTRWVSLPSIVRTWIHIAAALYQKKQSIRIMTVAAELQRLRASIQSKVLIYSQLLIDGCFYLQKKNKKEHYWII